MFNAAEETEKDWDTDLRDDVKSECETKYGPVAEIRVDKDSSVRPPLFSFIQAGEC